LTSEKAKEPVIFGAARSLYVEELTERFVVQDCFTLVTKSETTHYEKVTMHCSPTSIWTF